MFLPSIWGISGITAAPVNSSMERRFTARSLSLISRGKNKQNKIKIKKKTVI